MTLGLALALLFSVGWLPVYVFRAESMHDAFPTYRPAERLWVVLAPVLVSGHFALSAVTLSLMAGIPPWRALVGTVIFGGGIGFWFWGRVTIGPLRRRRLPEEPPLRFRRDGPFGVVRNPLYFGVLTAASAPVVVAQTPALLVTLALCGCSLAIRAAQEERRLHAQLGPAYAAYCREVKRLVPFVW
jgi:protein-S-isoprenylcysteine O-methyltransferase Ste14